MLQRPADAPPPLPLLAESDAVQQLRAALASLAARDAIGALPVRIRALVGRVTGRRDRYVLQGVVRATGAIADRCDELATRLNAQEALTADVTRLYGEELARLRAEVLHLQRTIDSSSGMPGSAN